MAESETQGRPSAAGLPCYLCGTLTARVCTDCGRFFCPQHGGERMCMPAGSRMAFPTRILCDGCAPDQEEMREQKAAAHALVGCVVGVAAIALAVSAYFMWQFYSIPLPPIP